MNDYLHIKYGETRALEIIHDIDRRYVMMPNIQFNQPKVILNSISAVPSYAGLRRFSEGRDFAQWTGDDSKALMKVLLNLIYAKYNNTYVANRFILPQLLAMYHQKWSSAYQHSWTFVTYSGEMQLLPVLL